uniref:Uncharacterized protein n=1 Tax=Knipowitschia caucasica TaxID=637954 RepID=A0AAV2L464_KNICA
MTEHYITHRVSPEDEDLQPQTAAGGGGGGGGGRSAGAAPAPSPSVASAPRALHGDEVSGTHRLPAAAN